MQKFGMGIFSVTALGVGAMVGAGIFALLGQVVLQAASMTYMSFIISGVAAIFCGYAYAKLASFLPDSGGVTSYYEAAFVSKITYGLFSLIYLFTLMISIAMLSKSFAIYFLGIFEVLSPSDLQINFVAIILIVLMTWLNMQSSGPVGKTELWLVSIKLTILLFLIVAVFLRSDLVTQGELAKPEASKFLASIGLTFFAYAGFGMMVNAAKEVKNPRRYIPIAIYLAISLVVLLYLSLAYVVLNFIPEAELEKSANTAVAVVANKLFGKTGGYVLSLAALIAFISGINAMFFSSYKIIHALGKQQVLPNFTTIAVTKYSTFGGWLASFIVLLSIVYFNFKVVINVASGAFLVSYLAVFVAAWRLRKETASFAPALLLGAALMLFILVSFVIGVE